MGMGKEMSTTVMNKGGLANGSGYMHRISCISAIDSAEICNGHGSFLVEKEVVANEKEEELKALNTCSSSSTSSIGKNSDISGRSMGNSGDTEEVQSSCKGPLDAMESLEEVLPIRRGISRFYNGKSKSFASLGDASSTSSIKELAKPENAYMRKRRNLLARSLAWDNSNKNRSSPLKSNCGRVTKRISNSSSRSSLALAVTMSSSDVYNTQNENLSPYPNTVSGSPSSLLHGRLHSQSRDYHSSGSSFSSPLQNFSACRSLSLVDLQHCISVAAPCTSTTTQLDINPPHASLMSCRIIKQ